jgi:hypothetical protein
MTMPVDEKPAYPFSSTPPNSADPRFARRRSQLDAADTDLLYPKRPVEGDLRALMRNISPLLT